MEIPLTKQNEEAILTELIRRKKQNTYQPIITNLTNTISTLQMLRDAKVNFSINFPSSGKISVSFTNKYGQLDYYKPLE